MNKRCIVNVATGDFYCNMQERLKESFFKSVAYVHQWRNQEANYKTTVVYGPGRSSGIDLLLWTDCLPPGSRHHSESPYGFKVHAIKAAYEKGYTSILWLDSPAYAVKEDISPIFEKIEKEGYYAMSWIDPLENWIAPSRMRGYSYDDFKGLNLPSGSCYGFHITGWGNGDQIFFDLLEDEQGGDFKSEVFAEGKCHRHDEAILARNLFSLSLPVFTFDPLFQSDSPECVIKSGGL